MTLRFVSIATAFSRVAIAILLLNTECSIAAEPTRWKSEFEEGRFKIHSDFAINGLESLLSELTAITSDIEVLLELPRRDDPIHIVLFETDSEYQRYMAAYFPKLPRRRALFIQDRGPGMLFTHWHPDVRTDIRHEVTHALLNHDNRSLPLWLDEGLAEYFEIPRHERFHGNPNFSSTHGMTSVRSITPIHELASILDVQKFSDAEYRSSWAWVHFLIHRRVETRQLLVRYLREYSMQSEDQATQTFDLERALRDVVPNLEPELEEHFRIAAAEVAAHRLQSPAIPWTPANPFLPHNQQVR